MTIRFLVFSLLFWSVQAFSQLTIKVTEIPFNTPTNASIFIAGNFQGWDPSDSNYQLTEMNDATYQITLMPSPGTLVFKFTRGSWDTVEGNADGEYLPDRTFDYNGSPTTLELEILSWEGESGANTAADNVQVFDNDFFIPQLNRNRAIWVYLPPDYDTSDKEYPVLYMHDGQNVFDAATSFSGEWEVDETLNALFAQGNYGCIVVAIDNGGAHRIDEYSPWVNPTYGGGEGDEYMDFVVNTLKPVIDANFRTRVGREFTGIMGSSLGGLISQYGFIEYQETISKAGIFSPSFWFSDEVYSHAHNTPKEYSLKTYMIAGQNESATMVDKVNGMEATLLNSGFSSNEIFKDIHPDGAHSEWYWRREFPYAYLWLFGDLDFTSTETPSTTSFRIYPNPTDSMLYVEGLDKLQNPSVEFVTLRGWSIRHLKLTGNALDVSFLYNGTYVLKIWEGEKVVFSDKLIVSGN